MFEGIAGHKKQIQLLSKAIETEKLAHAYVFTGPEAVGKKTLAKKLAAQLLEANPIPDFFHPDFLEINSIDGAIKIEQIRDLIYKLSLKPYQSKYKVALIDNAHEMTVEALNAILKTLEEPKSYTYIFLITNNANKLPKTILSRSQKINFGPVEFSEYENLLPQTMNDGQVTKIKTIAFGKPGLALKIATNEQYLEQLETTANFFKIFMRGQVADKLIAAYEVADLETSEIKDLFENWILQLRQGLYEQPSKSLALKIRAVAQARQFLQQNVNTKLLLTNLMLNT